MNQEADRLEKKNKAKKVARFYDEEKESDCIIQGYMKKRGHSFASSWQSKYAKLYPNRWEKVDWILPLFLLFLSNAYGVELKQFKKIHQ